MVRAKFQLQEVRNQHWSPTAQTFVFRPVGDDGIPENARFAKYTPSGEFTMLVDNPSAQSQFKLGEYYYVDFTEVPKPQPMAGAAGAPLPPAA